MESITKIFKIGHDLPGLYKETLKGGLAAMGLHGREKQPE
jgi:L-serine deaminase